MREFMPRKTLRRVRFGALKTIFRYGERKKVSHFFFFFFASGEKGTRIIYFIFFPATTVARRKTCVAHSGAFCAKPQFQSKFCASATAQQLFQALVGTTPGGGGPQRCPTTAYSPLQANA